MCRWRKKKSEFVGFKQIVGTCMPRPCNLLYGYPHERHKSNPHQPRDQHRDAQSF
jgi:hypothetical protein